jgi:6-phosphofructokinase
MGRAASHVTLECALRTRPQVLIRPAAPRCMQPAVAAPALPSLCKSARLTSNCVVRSQTAYSAYYSY